VTCFTSSTKRGKKFPDLFAFKRSAVTGGYKMHYAKGELQWDTDNNLGIYFADINGKPLSPDRLCFEQNLSAPLPDIVCRCPSYSAPHRASTRPATKPSTKCWWNHRGDKASRTFVLAIPLAGN